MELEKDAVGGQFFIMSNCSLGCCQYMHTQGRRTVHHVGAGFDVGSIILGRDPSIEDLRIWPMFAGFLVAWDVWQL